MKHTIEECVEYAHSKNGDCLSDTFVSVNSKMKWKCSKGHIWYARYHDILEKSWCPECYKLDIMYTIEEMHKIAVNRNGICLSTKYKNERSKIVWKCNKCKTEWQATPRSIIQGSWCPTCAIENKKVGRFYCKNCGKVCNTSQKMFCNNKCFHEFEYKDYIKQWLNGEIDGSRGNLVSWHIIRYLKETRGNKCEKCRWNEVNKFTKKIPLDIHHKDGNYSNNNIKNLEILCPNCHSLTNNYGGLNKGKGRPDRK